MRFAIALDVLPVNIGGDDGVTNPVLRGLNGLSDITLTVEVAGESFDGSVKAGAVFDDTARRIRLQKV